MVWFINKFFYLHIVYRMIFYLNSDSVSNVTVIIKVFLCYYYFFYYENVIIITITITIIINFLSLKFISNFLSIISIFLIV